MRYRILAIISVAIVFVQLLASCTFDRPTHVQNHTQGTVYGEVYLYDTHFVDEYIGALRLEVTEQNGQVTLKKENPKKYTLKLKRILYLNSVQVMRFVIK